MKLHHMIDLALGSEEGRRVDLAIPQGIYDGMTQAARDDVAGWYYAPECRIFGRLLTRTECWRQIEHRIGQGAIEATMFGTSLYTPALMNWPCFRQHVLRGEIELKEARNEAA